MRFCIGGFIAGLAGLLSPAFCASFQGLGFLPGGPGSFVGGISDNGQYVVGEGKPSASATVLVGFIWSQSSGMVSMGDWPNGNSRRGVINDVSDNGIVVGSYPSATLANIAFRWTVADGFQNLTSPDLASPTANAISTDGSTVYGFGSVGGNVEGFRWTQSTGMAGMDNPDGYTQIIVKAASADGSVAAAYADSGLASAFRWTTADGYQPLPGTSRALGVSADGSTIVGSTSATNSQAFRWTSAAGTTILDALAGGTSFSAHTASGDGFVITGQYLVAGTPAAFVWDPVNGMRDLKSVMLSYGLDVSGWSISDAWVAADGITFAGNGIHSGVGPEGWIAALPEPGVTIILLVCGGILSIRRNRS